MTQDYYGTKRVTAWMDACAEEGPDGYTVKYSDGRSSWIPKDEFELAYQPLDRLSFGHAVQAMKEGHKVARSGWNGKNMCIFLIPGSVITVTEGRPLAKVFDVDEIVSYLPHIDMKTADGKVVPWLASQTDMLSDDWMIVDELPVCSACASRMVPNRKEGDGSCFICLNCGEKSGKS
jgi:hypothetical protein